MGGSLSTIRWTPSYYSGIDASSGPGQSASHRHGQQQPRPPPLRKSKSFPPAEGGSSSQSRSSSPGNSTSNLSYDTYGSSEGGNSNYNDEACDHHGGGTASGILMGANAPPLYDACLVGRRRSGRRRTGRATTPTTRATATGRGLR